MHTIHDTYLPLGYKVKHLINKMLLLQDPDYYVPDASTPGRQPSKKYCTTKLDGRITSEKLVGGTLTKEVMEILDHVTDK